MKRRPTRAWPILRERLRRSGVALGVWLTGVSARADVDFSPDAGNSDLAEDARPLSAILGFDAERQALEAGAGTRLRALKRLWSLSHESPAQTAKLIDEWLSDKPKLGDTEVWLTLRVLATLNSEAAIRQHLMKALAGEQLDVSPESPYAALVPRVAALALAQSGDPDALSVLGEWLRRPSEKAKFVRDALLAHPPKDISPVLSASGAASQTLVETLGLLGDPASATLLRQVVKRATAQTQAAAAIALARLGVRETQDLAALWVGRNDSPPALLAASAWIYLHFDHPDRRAAFIRLTKVSPADALDVAEQGPADASFVELAEKIEALPDEQSRFRALALIGEQGDDAAGPLLRLFQRNVSLRWHVAQYLPRFAPTAVRPKLEEWTRDPELRAPAVSALAALAVLHPDDEAARVGLVEALREWSKDKNPATRDAAKAGLAAVDEGEARRLLASEHVDDLVAAALASHLHGRDYQEACLSRLHRSALRARGGPIRVSPDTRALSTALSFAHADASLSAQLLAAIANVPGPMAVTARAQAWQRAEPSSSLPSPLDSGAALERQSYAVSRAHHDGAVVDLLNALMLEADGEVRASLVETLQARPTLPTSARLLRWTAQFDPSPRVRASASGIESAPTNLKAVLVLPPAGAATAGYWVQTHLPGGLPQTLFFHHTHPALVFLQRPAFALRRVADHEPNSAVTSLVGVSEKPELPSPSTP